LDDLFIMHWAVLLIALNTKVKALKTVACRLVHPLSEMRLKNETRSGKVRCWVAARLTKLRHYIPMRSIDVPFR
jgi:hypothetical protein